MRELSYLGNKRADHAFCQKLSSLRFDGFSKVLGVGTAKRKEGLLRFMSCTSLHAVPPH